MKKSKTPITEDERAYFSKLFHFLINKTDAVYGMYYLPLLVRNISLANGMDVELRYAELNIPGLESPRIKYVVNEYKGHIIDIGSVIVKHHLQMENGDMLKELDCKFPEHFIYDLSVKEIGFKNIGFRLLKRVSSKRLINFQPHKLIKYDNMVLGAYCSTYACNIHEQVLKYSVQSKSKSSYGYMLWPTER